MILDTSVTNKWSVGCWSSTFSTWSSKIGRPWWSSIAIIRTEVSSLRHSCAHEPWNISSSFSLDNSVTSCSWNRLLSLLYLFSYVLKYDINYEFGSSIIHKHFFNKFAIIVLISNLNPCIFLKYFEIISIKIEYFLNKIPKQRSKLVPAKPINTLPDKMSANLCTICQVHRYRLNNKLVISKTGIQIRMKLIYF